MLSRPQVVGPVSVLTRSIRIQGQLVGATVSVASIGPNARTLITDTADASDTRLALPVGETLRPDDRLVAVQVLGEDSSPLPSPDMPLAVAVQSGPAGSPSDLSFVSYVSTLWECGRHIWLCGGVPGANAVVQVAGTMVGTGHFLESEGARLSLRQGLSNASVSAGQSVPGIGAGPTTSRVPLALPGVASTPLPAPIIDPTPSACQSAIHVSGVYDGAEVFLSRSDGQTVSEQRSASDTSALWILVDELKDGDELTVHQEVDKRCDRTTFATSKATVGPQGPVPTPTLGPLCVGTPIVTVKGLIPNAQVELNINGLVVRGQTPPSDTTLHMIVEPLAVGSVSARQLQCSTWSEPGLVPVDAAPAVIPPFEIVQPLHRCSSIVALNGVHEGAIVLVESRTLGPIGGPVVCDTSTDPFVIAVAPALRAPDDITVTQVACGGNPITATAPVVARDPTTPVVHAPVYIGDSTIRLEGLLLGATVTVSVTDKNGAQTQALTIGGATDTELTVTLTAPLNDGDTVTARQAFCDMLSGPSGPATARFVPLTADWWVWDGASPVNQDWNREYTVSGTFTNKGTTPIQNVHFTYWENTSSPGDLSPGPVNAGASTKGAYPTLKQSWSWLTPGVWTSHAPFSKTFAYHIDITGVDQTGANYPVMSTDPYIVVVSVSTAKIYSQATAASQAVAAIILGAAAAAAIAGVFTALVGAALGVAAGVAAGASAAAGAVALDPPEPDPDYMVRVPLPDPTPTDLGPAFPAFAQLLDVLCQVPAIELVKSTMEGRLLGAEQADAQDWVAVQRQDIVDATGRQRGLAATADSLLTSAINELAPVAMELETVYPDIRERMLMDGFPTDVARSSGLSTEQVAALDVLARSSEVAYPTGDLIASLQGATRALAHFVETLTVPTA